MPFPSFLTCVCKHFGVSEGSLAPVAGELWSCAVSCSHPETPRRFCPGARVSVAAAPAGGMLSGASAVSDPECVRVWERA